MMEIIYHTHEVEIIGGHLDGKILPFSGGNYILLLEPPSNTLVSWNEPIEETGPCIPYKKYKIQQWMELNWILYLWIFVPLGADIYLYALYPGIDLDNVNPQPRNRNDG